MLINEFSKNKNYQLHNVETVDILENGYASFCRLPEDVRCALVTEMGKNISAYAFSGCEIRFVLEGDKAVIKLWVQSDIDYLPRLYLYFGDFQSGWRYLEPITLHKGINEIEVSYPENFNTLMNIHKQNGGSFSPKVIRISGLYSSVKMIGIDGDIRKPSKEELPNKKIIFYGSSITHGSLSLNINTCYSAIIGRNVNADIINKGLAGSCFLEDEMVDFVLKYDSDIVSVELGTNCYRDEKKEWFKERVEALLNKHKEISPEKPLVLIDLFRAAPTNGCSEIVQKAISEYNNKNVTYINGYDILPGAEYYSADLIHPTTDSHYLIAKKLTPVFKNLILK